MEVACLQVASPPGEPEAERVRRVVELAGDAAPVDLLVLPEMWPVGYFAFDRYAQHAQPLDGPVVTGLAALAARLDAHVHAGSLVERDDRGRLYNTSVLLDPAGTVVHTYRKHHVFGYRSREAELLTPGDDPGVADTALGTVGMTTCYDLRFPELYRLLVDRGAELLIVPAAWPTVRRDHWRLLCRARAVENQLAVVACNGSGEQDGTELAGRSLVIDPWGRVVAEADADETLLRASLDPGDVGAVRAEFPALADRRIPVGDPGDR